MVVPPASAPWVEGNPDEAAMMMMIAIAIGLVLLCVGVAAAVAGRNDCCCPPS